MTVPAREAPEAAPSVVVPTARPVVRFVAVLGGVAVVLVALWWSGLVAARVELSVSDRFDRRTNEGVALLTVRNAGPLRVRVAPPRQAPRPGPSYFEPPVRLSVEAPARPVRVEAGGSTRFIVRYTVDCSGYARAGNTERGAVSPSLRLRVRVEGFLGMARSRTHDEVALVGACGDPVDAAEE